MWDIISYFLRVRSAVKKTNQSYLNIIIEFATIINFVTFSNVDFFIISNIGYFYSYVMYINVYLFNKTARVLVPMDMSILFPMYICNY